MPLLWISPPPEREFRDVIAWWPLRAFDEYTGRTAWVWLREVRVHKDGLITFSSFWC